MTHCNDRFRSKEQFRSVAFLLKEKSFFLSLVNTDMQLMSIGGPRRPPLGDISNFLVRHFFFLSK